MHRFATAGFTLVVLLLVATFISAPIVLVSMVADLLSEEETYVLAGQGATLAPAHARLRIEVQDVDELKRIVHLRVSGTHVCGGCAYTDRITLYSISGALSGRRTEGAPPSAIVNLPPNADTVTQTIDLPLHGDLIRYPYDTHPLWLGVSMQRVGTDGAVQTLSPSDAAGHLYLDMRNETPHLVMDRPTSIAPDAAQPSRTRIEYLMVQATTFHRPLYLKILVPMLGLLTASAAAYAVLLRPFDQLLLNSGGLILGVWGIRGLLLGSYPAYSTLVDVVLSAIIVFLLCVISVRAMHHLHDRAGLNLLPWRHPTEPPAS